MLKTRRFMGGPPGCRLHTNTGAHSNPVTPGTITDSPTAETSRLPGLGLILLVLLLLVLLGRV
jgi:hypothetical protein